MSSVHIEFAQFGDFDTFDVFRSTESIDPNNLPVPIQTGLTTMYCKDESVIDGVIYYYVIRVNRLGESMLSDELVVSTVVTGGDDVYYSNVAALLHFDNTNENGNMKDEVGVLSWVPYDSGTVLSDDQPKFGTKSLFIDNRTSSYSNVKAGLEIPSDIFSFGVDDKFTLEFFFKKTTTSGNACMVAFNNASGSGRWAFFCRTGDVLKLAVYDGSTFIDQTTTVSINTWNHLAFVKDGIDNYLFLNGNRVQHSSRATTGYAESIVTIGDNGLLNERYTGYIDELRITKGVARYVSEFIPPSAPF